MRSVHPSHLERERLSEQRIHQAKLKQVKPQIDNKPPKPAPHLHSNSKKILKGRLRQHEIQKDNQLLLSKLMKIENSRSWQAPTATVAKPTFEQAKKQKDISVANVELLRRIQTARAHYPRAQFLETYQFTQYLAAQLSENAKRVPRTTDFASEGKPSNRSMHRPWSARVI